MASRLGRSTACRRYLSEESLALVLGESGTESQEEVVAELQAASPPRARENLKSC